MAAQLFDQRVATGVGQAGMVLRKSVEQSSHSLNDVSFRLDRRIQVVVAQLESKSHQQIRIEDMARLVNLSPGRLAHLFKSETNLSIQQYLTQLRLAKAKHHLEISFLSIKEISALVGFASVTRFVASFKNLVGTTPAQYRKRFSRMPVRSAERLAIARSANR